MDEADRAQHAQERADDRIDQKARDVAIDDLFERAVVMAAEGLVKNADTNEKIASALTTLTDKVVTVETTQQAIRRVLVIVLGSLIVGALAAGLSAYALFRYTVPNSKILVDCTTPSTPRKTHPCNDRSGQTGFNLSVAIIRCERGLPTNVHTDEVKNCLAHEMGLTLAPSSPTP